MNDKAMEASITIMAEDRGWKNLGGSGRSARRRASKTDGASLALWLATSREFVFQTCGRHVYEEPVRHSSPFPTPDPSRRYYELTTVQYDGWMDV
jgi:hypothetical protein